MAQIDDYDFSGKRAVVRVDFNVPLDKETAEVLDDTRIKAALPTLKKILDGGGSAVVMSHLGRPKGPTPELSMKHVRARFSELLGRDVQFVEDIVGDDAKAAANNLNPGEVLLIENLRFNPGEKQGDEKFAEGLAQLGEVYVNDAFGTAHRAHASTAIIAQYFPEDKMFGYLIEKEIKSVSVVLSDGKKPVSAIIGGAKVSSKISIIENLLPKVDNLIIGGGMAYTFIKSAGGQVGNSLVENDHLETAKKIVRAAEEQGVRVLLPEDTLAAKAFDNDAERAVFPSNEIPDGWMGMDIGPKAIREYSACINESQTILWNGPVGVFEMSNFENGTREVGYAVVTATERGAFSLVGGGDSVAAVNKYDLAEHVNHVSTGGGAMLEYLEGKELPGIKAIQG